VDLSERHYIKTLRVLSERPETSRHLLFYSTSILETKSGPEILNSWYGSDGSGRSRLPFPEKNELLESTSPSDI